MKIKANAIKIMAVLNSALLVLAPMSAATAANQNISVMDNSFSPQIITVNVGDTVTWTNNGMMNHTITADNNSFDSGTLSRGATFSHTFNTAGNFPYYCRFHGGPGGSGMSGIIMVANQTNTNTNNTYSNNTTNTYSALNSLSATVSGPGPSPTPLVVRQIIPTKTSGAANGTFSNGWKWVFDVTAPTSETNVMMKFNNWFSNSGILPVSSNMRFFSSQSSNAWDENSAIYMSSPNTYSSSMFVNGDLGGYPGQRHFQITVEVRIPYGTPTGNYTTNFGINTQ